MANKKTDSDAVMSTSSFVIASILMSIPVIGLLICLVWAFVSCGNMNKRNFARAYLIFMVIGIVFSLIGYFVIYRVMAMLGFSGGFGGFREYLDILKQ